MQLSNLSNLESFKFIFRSLWDYSESQERIKLNIMDTILFSNGQPIRWLFTSEKTGEIMKKRDSRLNLKEIIIGLKKRSNSLRGRKLIHFSTSKFAAIWAKTGYDDIAFNLVDENELYTILTDKLKSELIVAVQVFFGSWPFKGCGIFEHYVYLNEIKEEVHKTYELINLPHSIDLFPFGNDNNNHHQSDIDFGNHSSSKGKPKVLLDDIGVLSEDRNRLVITETHHDILALKTTQIKKILEAHCQTSICKLKLTYYFNTAWAPFLVSCCCVRIVNGAKLNFRRMITMTPLQDEKKSEQIPEKRLQPPSIIAQNVDSDPIISSDSNEKISPKKNVRISDHDHPINADTGKETNGGKSDYHHDNSSNLAASNATKASSYEGNHEDIFISSSPKKHPVKKHNADEFVIFVKKDKSPTFAPHTKLMEAKSYMMLTDCVSYRRQINPNQVRGSQEQVWNYERDLRRPTSAPSNRRSSLTAQQSSAARDSYMDTGPYGLNVSDFSKKSALAKRLPLQSEICHGDYCDLLLGSEVELDDSVSHMETIGLIKVTNSDGTERIRSRRTPHQVTCKSVLLAKAECDYVGGNIAKIYDAASADMQAEGLVTLAATKIINQVSEKCRQDAFKGVAGAANGKVPSMTDIQMSTIIYRRLIYTHALAKVHPTRFYYTVPVCETCFKMYTAMDAFREDIIFDRDTDFSKQKSTKSETQADITSARQKLKSKANAIRESKKNVKGDKDDEDCGIFDSEELYDEEGPENRKVSPRYDQLDNYQMAAMNRLNTRFAENEKNPLDKSNLLTPHLARGQSTDKILNASKGAQVRTLIGKSSNGSLSSWVDMLGAKKRPSSANESRRDAGNTEYVDKRLAKEIILDERRAQILNERKSEAPWEQRLRDPPQGNNPRSRSPSPDRLYADVIATTTNIHPFEWGRAIHVTSYAPDTLQQDAKGRRPMSANSAMRVRKSYKESAKSTSSFDVPIKRNDVSNKSNATIRNSHDVSSSNMRNLTFEEQQELARLKQKIVYQQHGELLMSINHIIGKVGNSNFAYGNQNFINAACLPFTAPADEYAEETLKSTSDIDENSDWTDMKNKVRKSKSHVSKLRSLMG